MQGCVALVGNKANNPTATPSQNIKNTKSCSIILATPSGPI
jgi:hypothetical protein